MIVAIRTQFYTHPVSKRTTLNRLNFLPSASTSARANRCAYRNGNTAVPFGRGKRKGGPTTLPNRYGVTFCLFTFDYTIWHTFTRSAAARRTRLGITQCRYSNFVPYFPNFTRAAASSFLTKKTKKKESEKEKRRKPCACIHVFVPLSKINIWRYLISC